MKPIALQALLVKLESAQEVDNPGLNSLPAGTYLTVEQSKYLALKLRAADDLLCYAKIVATEIAGGGHDYHSHRLWQTAEAYERAGVEK